MDIHQHGDPEMGEKYRRRLALYTPWQAPAEWVLRASTVNCGPLGDAGISCQVIDECLNENLFSSLSDARETMDKLAA